MHIIQMFYKKKSVKMNSMKPAMNYTLFIKKKIIHVFSFTLIISSLFFMSVFHSWVYSLGTWPWVREYWGTLKNIHKMNYWLVTFWLFFSLPIDNVSYWKEQQLSWNQGCLYDCFMEVLLYEKQQHQKLDSFNRTFNNNRRSTEWLYLSIRTVYG